MEVVVGAGGGGGGLRQPHLVSTQRGPTIGYPDQKGTAVVLCRGIIVPHHRRDITHLVKLPARGKYWQSVYRRQTEKNMTAPIVSVGKQKREWAQSFLAFVGGKTAKRSAPVEAPLEGSRKWEWSLDKTTTGRLSACPYQQG